MRRAAAVLVPGLMLASILTACAGSRGGDAPNPYLTAAIGENGPGTPPGPGVFPVVPATHAHVQLQCPLVSAVHYDPARIPVARVDGVYVCTTRPWDDAPDGTPQIEEFVDRVAEADVAGLLEAYAAPDAAVPDDVVCAAVVVDPMIVWIHYGDQQITPVYAPKDECSNPQAGAAAVYDGLELHRLLVAREKLTS
jgi:hypothetical protein